MQRPTRSPSEPNAADAGARHRFRHLVAPIVVALALGAGVLLAVAWAVSSRAVVGALDFAVERSGGRLSYEGASGSLTGRVAVDRIAWQDGATRIVAERAEAAISPRALLQWRIVLSDLGAKRVSVELPPGDGKDTPLPASLALPLPVAIDTIRIGRIDWKAGANTGTVDGVSLGYAGDAAAHRLRDVDVRIAGARLAGEAELAAARPFALRGSVVLELGAPYPPGRVDATLGGTLAALDVDARGTVADVAGEARARLAPLAAQPLGEARVAASAVDLARLGAGWPATRIDVTVVAKPVAGGYAGTLEATNAMPGTLDAARVPLARLAAHVALAGDTLALDAVSAQTGDGASLAGSGTVDVRTGHSRWQLAVRDLDLAGLHRSLVPTRLRGSLDADVREDLQRLRGEVRQQDMRLAFDGSYDGREIVASRLVAQARDGEVSGSARIALDRARAFSFDARARRFDPSRFGAFPAGMLDGTVAARGTLAPLAVDADVVAAPGSRLAGLPAQGRLQGRFTRTEVSALDADVTLGATKLSLEGAYGRPGQRLVARLASKRLDEIATLVPGAPRPLGGAVVARATIDGLDRAVRIGVDVKGERLAIGSEHALATLAVEGAATVAAPFLPARVEAFSAIELDVRATGVRMPAGALESAHGHLVGAAGAHALAFDAATGHGRLEGRLAGALALPPTGAQWRGRVESLAVRDVPGFAPVALAAPVAIDVGPGRLDVGPARVESGTLRADVDGVEWRPGSLVSRGRFRGLPVAPMLKQAGVESRWPTDLMLQGEWDLASVPDWRGTVRISRESGDVYVEDPGNDGASRIALGIQTLAIDARLDGPKLVGTGELRGGFGGNVLADFAIAAPSGASHPFSAAAPLSASVRAHLPSLASLQPWLGSSARVQGQAIADVTMTGVLGKPVLAGQLVGYGLRLDMPQYGVGWRDGRLRIASGPEGIVLEEFEIAGGAGRFVASGTIALPRDGAAGGAASRIAWRAEDFRALNRPDMRVVVDGEGTLANVGGRLVLKGELKADEGNFEYRSRAETTLADDIVVVGRPRPQRSRPADVAIGDTPLEIDLALDLGRDLRFAAEGLDTRLAGRLRVTSRPGGVLEGRGTIRTVRGTYWAFGQRLDIDRGRVIFDGPLANPSLDIVALRRNLAVEAGVEITGNVRAPLVRLTSNPPVPDSEKLSWLLTGGPSGSTSAKEAAALGAATAALVGRGGKSITQQVAQSIGLDDISVGQRSSGAGADALEGQVLTVGKRLTDRLYVAYEQGLTIATNALRIEYVLSRYFTVSAFAGTSSGIAINFRRSWR
jgi:translocation and assembly module TamB